MHRLGYYTRKFVDETDSHQRCGVVRTGFEYEEYRSLSYQGHTANALALASDEGRGRLRKAPGSCLANFDPEMSEWGNPLRGNT
jgi:hypothetical protein